MADKIMFNGKEISMDDLNKKMQELKALQALQKEAKKAGLIKAVKVGVVKERSANYNLVLAQFKPVTDTNEGVIDNLFKEYDGQDSISFDVNDKYHVILRSKAVVKAKQDARKAEKKAAEPEKTAEPATK